MANVAGESAEGVAGLAALWPPAPAEQFADTGVCPRTGRAIRLCYNTFGKPTDPCMLLIMGFGCQGPYWDSRFCTMLADAGFYVIRYDNRDVGLSTHLDDLPAPFFLRLALPRWLSLGEGRLPYSIEDMADDAARLLRVLGIPQAHVVGCSLGGMIAQSLTLLHPRCVRSLCLLSTSSGTPWPRPHALLGTLTQPRDNHPETILAYNVEKFRAIAGRLPFPTDEFIAGMRWTVARSTYVGGHSRQMAAIARSPDRSAGLRRLNPGYAARCRRAVRRGPLSLARDALAWVRASWSAMAAPRQRRATGEVEEREREKTKEEARRAPEPFIPVVVLHGGSDPVIPLSNGVRLVNMIPGAKLVVYPDFGHYFPSSLFRPLADQMILNAREGEAAAKTA